jgi:subtilisin family serine protease
VRRRSTRGAGLAITTALLAVLVGSAMPASADQVSDGLWYFTRFNVQQAHDAGYTGAGVTIAVIDNQIYPQLPELSGADVEVQPDFGCKDAEGQPIPAATTDYAASHGSNVTALIAGNGVGYAGQRGVQGVAPKAKILFFSDGASATDTKDTAVTCDSYSGDPSAAAIAAAVKARVQIISISQAGPDTPQMAAAVARAVKAGIVIVAALSDTEPNTGAEFPAESNGVVSVQAIDSTGGVLTTNGVPNADPYTDVAGPGVGVLNQGGATSHSWQDQSLGDGTSFATPIVAGFLALVKQKYPQATGNQLIQSLIHNTGKSDHALAYDPKHLTGYGVAVLDHLLAVDPTKYPDANPLIASGKNQSPTAARIAGSAGSTPSPLPSAAKPAARSQPPAWLLPVLIGGGLLIVLAAIALVIVFATRRARRAPQS